MVFVALFTLISRVMTRQFLAAGLFALATLPVLATAGTGTADAASLEQQVDRLLWALVNDERFSHLQVAANYEGLRAALIGQTCLVSAAPCLKAGATLQHHVITTEITPEQELLVEQLLFTLHSASASVTPPPAHLLVTASE